MSKAKSKVQKNVDNQESKSKEILEFREEAEEIMKDDKAFNTLAKYTFNGLKKSNIAQAIIEGRMKGFELDDFFKQNVYAIPFYNKKKKKQEYSLVVSIDHMRKQAMRSGQSGKSKPTFTYDDEGNLESCSVTVWRKGGDERGYTSTVYFDEYDGDNRIWNNKPRTMLAKVAEMHALRMAFPEELQNQYIEEEYDKERKTLSEDEYQVKEENGLDREMKEKIDDIDDLKELNKFYKENKGKGRAFDNYITKRQDELQNS